MTQGERRDRLRLVPPTSAPAHRVEVFKTYLRYEGQLAFQVRARDLEPEEVGQLTPYKWYAECQAPDCGWRACSWSWWRQFDMLASGDMRAYLEENPGVILDSGALVMGQEHVRLAAEALEPAASA